MPSTELYVRDETLQTGQIPRRLYFINEQVEWLLTLYIWTGCTKVELRDAIMSHATELIRQIIRKQGLHTIYPGHEDSAFGDLLQTAWCQIERTLYKYRSRPHCRVCFSPDRPSDSILYDPPDREFTIKTLDEIVEMHPTCPHCRAILSANPMIHAKQGTFGGSETVLYKGMSKVFNMWSQIARTVMLAMIKKENRDRRNSGAYTSHLETRTRPLSDMFSRFLTEAKEMCQFDDEHTTILNELEWLAQNDEKPHDSLLSKLVDRTGFHRTTVAGLLKMIKLRSFEFSDSPMNRKLDSAKYDRRKPGNVDYEEE